MDRPASEYFKVSAEAKARMSEGIERNRKGYFTVEVVDSEGKRVDAEVRFKQKNHEFRFGANLFMLDEIPDSEEKNELYKQKFASLFNMATLPFYWDATEPEENKTRYHKTAEKMYRRPPVDLCLEFCEKHGIEPREHALAYEHFFPDWLKSKSDGEVKIALEKRMREISERYSSRIPTIEVTNEMFWGYGESDYKTDFYNNPNYIEYCFRLAEKYFPANELCINEWTGLWNDNGRAQDNYYLYIENALLKGARIDAIGLQYHLFYRRENYYDATRRLLNADHLYRILDNYSRLNRPIEITEITVPAFSALPEDEQHQAEIIENLYTLWFSHDKVKQIIYWNLVDGYAYGAPIGDMQNGENYFHGGLLRFDLSEKPAYKVIKKLIKETWRTDETVKTKEGIAEVKAFYGDYEVEIKTKDKTIVKTLPLLKQARKNFKIVL